MADVKRIALLSGGGDCPGLNAVIRAVTKAAINEYGKIFIKKEELFYIVLIKITYSTILLMMVMAER